MCIFKKGTGKMQIHLKALITLISLSVHTTQVDFKATNLQPIIMDLDLILQT